jgi:uncharacterized protein (DUF983 family)
MAELQEERRNVSICGPVTMMTALERGFAGKCPCCGRGRLFEGFLQVARECEVCGEPFYHHRADDLPAYLVLLFVGHFIVTLLLALDAAYAPPYWVEFAIWIPLTLLLSSGLLQPVKGAVVAMQWQMGMHGFAKAKSERERALTRTAGPTVLDATAEEGGCRTALRAAARSAESRAGGRSMTSGSSKSALNRG